MAVLFLRFAGIRLIYPDPLHPLEKWIRIRPFAVESLDINFLELLTYTASARTKMRRQDR
jgi:hypothetical protein